MRNVFHEVNDVVLGRISNKSDCTLGCDRFRRAISLEIPCTEGDVNNDSVDDVGERRGLGQLLSDSLPSYNFVNYSCVLKLSFIQMS